MPATLNATYLADLIDPQVIADYIAGLDMSVFVMDYDHNADNNDHYAESHEPFFKTIRAKQPNTPII